ncbi:MAG: OsmC family protein [Balneolaceae bacterium]|nr:OsmC family protein [Balneolaceae bacterium]
MPTKNAEAVWKGDLKTGSGIMKLESGSYEGTYTFASRFENGKGTNPEELIGAAHAGCYSMALSNELAQAGFTPDSVETKADVVLDPTSDGPPITTITLNVNAQVPGIDEGTFMEHANGAKENCPVSQALAGVDIKLNAKLNS